MGIGYGWITERRILQRNFSLIFDVTGSESTAENVPCCYLHVEIYVLYTWRLGIEIKLFDNTDSMKSSSNTSIPTWPRTVTLCYRTRNISWRGYIHQNWTFRAPPEMITRYCTPWFLIPMIHSRPKFGDLPFLYLSCTISHLQSGEHSLRVPWSYAEPYLYPYKLNQEKVPNAQ